MYSFPSSVLVCCMPFLNAQYGGHGIGPDGKQVAIPPVFALWQRGPCVQVTIELADQVAQELIKRNEPLPPPSAGLALIDTGSASSCVDEEAAKAMHLPIVGVTNMASASHASHKAFQYPIKVTIQGLPIAFNAPNAIGAPLKVQDLIAIIGRDIL